EGPVSGPALSCASRWVGPARVERFDLLAATGPPVATLRPCVLSTAVPTFFSAAAERSTAGISVRSSVFWTAGPPPRAVSHDSSRRSAWATSAAASLSDVALVEEVCREPLDCDEAEDALDRATSDVGGNVVLSMTDNLVSTGAGERRARLST